MPTKEEILKQFELYRIQGGGIGSWLTGETSDDVFARLSRIDKNPLSAVQLNQLFVLGHEAPVSDGFFEYYWQRLPKSHPYDIEKLEVVAPFERNDRYIVSLEHLRWGLHRLYVDGLLFFGNVRTAFRTLRDYTYDEIELFFRQKRFDTQGIKDRGPPLELNEIRQDRRYLISEMACKSYGADPRRASDLSSALIEAFQHHRNDGGKKPTIGLLLSKYLPLQYKDKEESLQFSASEIAGDQVDSPEELERLYQRIAADFANARQLALKNTEYYLSMITDLDVYVATSMRTPSHFVSMAQICEEVFADPRLKSMNLRYFDPTLSAAAGHEDKGLIECLMVKCAKALVYCGGDKESYGKDAEAAMALSLGKPVIFFSEKKAQFYREVHPLTRLIQFDTGVAVGAMVTDNLSDVSELLHRTFENKMVYRLNRSTSGSLRLVEERTGSVVRLQTSDKLLSETFWNHYHYRPRVSALTTRSGPTRLRPPAVAAQPPSNIRRAHQNALDLQGATEPVALAARGSRTASEVSSLAATSATHDAKRSTVTLTEEAIFDAKSSVQRVLPTGAKRFAAFWAWCRGERISFEDATKLLAFVETTLESHGFRSSFVYKPSDLERWYLEMSNGVVVGSKK